MLSHVHAHMAQLELGIQAPLFTSPIEQRQNMGHMSPEHITEIDSLSWLYLMGFNAWKPEAWKSSLWKTEVDLWSFGMESLVFKKALNILLKCV